MKINKLRMLASDKGFTLIELMIVIAIIGILAAIAIPNFISYRDKAFCSAVEKDAASLQGGLADYFAIPSNRTFANQGPVKEMLFVNSQSMKMSGDNLATITNAVDAQGKDVFVISVQDGSGRCPQNYRDPAPKWGGTGAIGSGTDTYSITM